MKALGGKCFKPGSGSENPSFDFDFPSTYIYFGFLGDMHFFSSLNIAYGVYFWKTYFALFVFF